MRKLLIASVLVTLIFGLGYLIGQAHGISFGSAASAPANAQGTDLGTPDGFWHHDGSLAVGQVTAVTDDHVTIKPPSDAMGFHGQTRVTTIVRTPSTQYFTDCGKTATKNSLVVGSSIIATGTLNTGGTTLTATRITVWTGEHRGDSVRHSGAWSDHAPDWNTPGI